MRKKLLLGALTAFGLTLSMQVTAQQDFKCGTAERLRKLYAENPVPNVKKFPHLS